MQTAGRSMVAVDQDMPADHLTRFGAVGDVGDDARVFSFNVGQVPGVDDAGVDGMLHAFVVEFDRLAPIADQGASQIDIIEILACC